MLRDVMVWFQGHPELTAAVLAASSIMFVVGLISVPVVLTRMRADHFVAPKKPLSSWAGKRPLLRALALAVKNMLGALLVLVGLLMLVLPGQGLLTILVGITLLDFPGKRAIELWLVRRRPVLSAINWIRGKAEREPLQLPEPDR